MENTFGYVESWPQELKDAEKRHYRACCRVRFLESKLDHAGLCDFEQLITELDAAREEVRAAASAFHKLNRTYGSKHE